jgi:hypothetical protein
VLLPFVLLLGESVSGNDTRSMRVASDDIQQELHLSYLELPSTTSRRRLRGRVQTDDFCTTLPLSAPFASTAGPAHLVSRLQPLHAVEVLLRVGGDELATCELAENDRSDENLPFDDGSDPGVLVAPALT